MTKNNTGTYLKYAVSEILLVVIGILIALGINNWNEERKERISEQVILESLQLNLNENLKLLDLANEAAIAAYNASLDLHQSITPRGATLSRKQIDSLFSITFDYFTFDPNSGTMFEVINSGELNLLQNKELKNKISSWSGIVQDTQRDVDIANDHAFDKMIIFLAKHGSISNLPIGNKIIQKTKSRPKPASSFNVDYQNLMSSAEFENLMSWHSTNLLYIINEYHDFKSFLGETIVLVESELNRY